MAAQVLILYMKTLAALSLAAALSGCTTPTTTRTANTELSHRELSEKRVHTKAELEKTGRPEIGEALQTVDPAVYISGRGR